MNYLNELLTIELDATNRIAVYFDEYGFPYEELIGDALGVFTIQHDRNIHRIVGGDLSDELSRLSANVRPELVESALRKYLTICNRAFRVIDLQGYSPSEWASVIVYDATPGIQNDLKEMGEDLKKWFRGDVYVMAHEQLVTYTAPSGDTIDRWEAADSIGGVMADTKADVLAMALETFNLETVTC